MNAPSLGRATQTPAAVLPAARLGASPAPLASPTPADPERVATERKAQGVFADLLRDHRRAEADGAAASRARDAKARSSVFRDADESGDHGRRDGDHDGRNGGGLDGSQPSQSAARAKPRSPRAVARSTAPPEKAERAAGRRSDDDKPRIARARDGGRAATGGRTESIGTGTAEATDPGAAAASAGQAPMDGGGAPRDTAHAGDIGNHVDSAAGNADVSGSGVGGGKDNTSKAGAGVGGGNGKASEAGDGVGIVRAGIAGIGVASGNDVANAAGNVTGLAVATAADAGDTNVEAHSAARGMRRAHLDRARADGAGRAGSPAATPAFAALLAQANDAAVPGLDRAATTARANVPSPALALALADPTATTRSFDASARIDPATTTNIALTAFVDGTDFQRAFATHVSVLVEHGVQRAELHLNPAETGPVSVHIAVDGSQARIDFGADLAATRAAIERGLPELAAALRDAGFTLAGGGVFEHAHGRARDDDGSRERHATGIAATACDERGAADAPAATARSSIGCTSAGGLDVYA